MDVEHRNVLEALGGESHGHVIDSNPSSLTSDVQKVDITYSKLSCNHPGTHAAAYPAPYSAVEQRMKVGPSLECARKNLFAHVLNLTRKLSVVKAPRPISV